MAAAARDKSGAVAKKRIEVYRENRQVEQLIRHPAVFCFFADKSFSIPEKRVSTFELPPRPNLFPHAGHPPASSPKRFPNKRRRGRLEILLGCDQMERRVGSGSQGRVARCLLVKQTFFYKKKRFRFRFFVFAVVFVF